MGLIEAGYIEDILIKSIGPMALNSANGDFYIDRRPGQDLLARINWFGFSQKNSFILCFNVVFF